jgi:hypothetical protein
VPRVKLVALAQMQEGHLIEFFCTHTAILPAQATGDRIA